MKKYTPAFVALFILISCGPKKVTPEIFLIPSGYHGEVKVIFDEPCGSKESFDGKKRLYVIPESGILISQFKQEFGRINQEYYYIDAKGARTLIPKMMLQDFNEPTSTQKNEHEPPRNQIGIFSWGTTGTTLQLGGKNYMYYIFYVGTYLEVRDSFCSDYSGVGSYPHMFDSLEAVQIKNCRIGK